MNKPLDPDLYKNSPDVIVIVEATAKALYNGDVEAAWQAVLRRHAKGFKRIDDPGLADKPAEVQLRAVKHQ
ncbi:MAG: glycoside hydrolase family 92 protein [Chloroflexi bacterium]|nr:glycoside hydrolase family 92 protein [Chloroflexota bacterium]